MKRFVALLRAVNVGGTGKLAMADLRALCEEAGLRRVQTYIQSGNVVFDSALEEPSLILELEDRLRPLLGDKVGLLIRSAEQMAAIQAGNPFADSDPKHVYALFLSAAPPPNALDLAKGRTDEALTLGAREIYIRYPSGQGRSKLRLPEMRQGTMRNMNTVAKLAEMARGGGG